MYVSSYPYMCVLILLYMCAQLAEERRRRAVLKSATNYIRLRILLYLCPHTTMCVSSYILPYVRPHTITSVPSYYYMCVLILLYMCPRTAICVLILLYVSSYYCLCPHTNFVVFNTTQKFHSIKELLLLYYYMCPHTTI